MAEGTLLDFKKDFISSSGFSRFGAHPGGKKSEVLFVRQKSKQACAEENQRRLAAKAEMIGE
ncbi:hypothetical protein B5M42_010395 [Paenibacillus athensensis]|uniref:Uncharacterized protein n=1 Tax=Paenibacillus athensensis TaxID=1967502 RepID=A0A4Y8Q359_9BACL|nr:hypothetical protein [Paenibacillus athensensis]MCD1259246.1 hypothetical protein [Paenibacillus athensensis]